MVSCRWQQNCNFIPWHLLTWYSLHIQLKLRKFGMAFIFAAGATLSIFWNWPSYDSGSEKNKDCRLAAPEMDGCYLGEHNCQLPDNMQILRWSPIAFPIGIYWISVLSITILPSLSMAEGCIIIGWLHYAWHTLHGETHCVHSRRLVCFNILHIQLGNSHPPPFSICS